METADKGEREPELLLPLSGKLSHRVLLPSNFVGPASELLLLLLCALRTDCCSSDRLAVLLSLNEISPLNVLSGEPRCCCRGGCCLG